MAIEVAVDHGKHGWEVEILVSAEHKHDFVARRSGRRRKRRWIYAFTRSSSSWRRYKEKVQNHKGDVTHGGSSPRSFEHPPAPVETPTDPDDV